MIYNNNHLADILRVCEIKDLIWVMRFVFKVLKYIIHMVLFVLYLKAFRRKGTK